MTIYRKHKNVIPLEIKHRYTYEESLKLKEELNISFRGVIYCIVNDVNNKIYIGKDERNDPKYMGSGKLLGNAKKKYGIENFTKYIIDVTATTKEELRTLETRYISPHLGKSYCYNIGDGGEHNDNFTNNPNKEEIRKKFISIKSNISDETRSRMSESGKVKVFTPLHKKHLSLSLKGKKKPKGFGTKVSKALKGRISPNKGKKTKESTKAIIRIKSKNFWANNYELMCSKLKGIPKSEEGKRNMRVKHNVTPKLNYTLRINSIKCQARTKLNTLTSKGFSKNAAKFSTIMYVKSLYKRLNVKFNDIEEWIQML